MGSTPSATYIYAYITFGCVYLAAAAACAIAAFRASSRLARCVRQEGAVHPSEPAERVITRAFRLLDWVQGAALLPIAYIVVSAGLGSLILKGQPASVMNIVWVLLTALCAGASVMLAVLGTRELLAIGQARPSCAADDSSARDLERVSTRLGASAVVLLLVGAFVAVNLLSVLADLPLLLKTDFLL
ncbi:MAG: hypothetical protein N3B11_02440 [Coriobacteriia bacterium]|nr:hypothetical protein [Coriobacteriia bacterium]